MLESALKIYKPEASIFPQCLHKILFMVASEEFWRVDGECNFICLFPSSKLPNQLPLGIFPPTKMTKESFDAILTQISYHPFRLRPVEFATAHYYDLRCNESHVLHQDIKLKFSVLCSILLGLISREVIVARVERWTKIASDLLK